MDKNGKRGFTATVIRNSGGWIEYEKNEKEGVCVRVNGTRKLIETVLSGALGVGSDKEIIMRLGDNGDVSQTLGT